MDSEYQPLGSQREAEQKGNNVLVGGSKGRKKLERAGIIHGNIVTTSDGVKATKHKYFCFGQWAMNSDESFPSTNDDPTSTAEWKKPYSSKGNAYALMAKTMADIIQSVVGSGYCAQGGLLSMRNSCETFKQRLEIGLVDNKEASAGVGSRKV